MEHKSNSIRRVRPAVAAAAVLALACVAAAQESADAPIEAPSRVLPEMMDKRTVDAIGRGLNYLAETQMRNGMWRSSGRTGSYPTAMTSLAALAFMSGGSTPVDGPYSRQVRKAMDYAIGIAKEHNDGLICDSRGGEGRSMHGHGFAMLFLAQCYGMQPEAARGKAMREVLTAAAELTSKSQSDLGEALKHAGGWYYSPGSNNDEGSVTVTQLQALRACRNVGIKVNKRTIERAVAYLKHCQQADGGICYSARSRGSSRPAISAAAIACFYAAGVYDRKTGGTGEEAEMVDKLVRYCRQAVGEGLGGSGHWFYTQYYYAQAMYQRGGKDWKDYYPKLRDRLLGMQAPDGSWNGDGIGTVYGTALAMVMLQLPYGYLPICQR